MATADLFNSTLQQTADWLKSIVGEESIVDERQAYAALRAVLHQLRDRLTVEEASDLAAQMPMLVRGFFYEGWNPARVPQKVHRDEFVEGVRHKLSSHPEIDPHSAIQAVFKILSEKITPGELEDVIQMLPKDLQALWPERPSQH